VYSHTDHGKRGKKIQNDKRKKGGTESPPLLPGEAMPEPEVSGVDEFSFAMLTYVQMLTSLIEGRRVSMEEVKEMLARVVRQRSMVHCRKLDHIVASLREHPS
jgi:hypothetical protein